MSSLPRVLAVVGPTAAGKSRLGLELAARLKLPILCCDSVQVYRRLDIGSAKPTLEERAAVPHHLLDLVDPDADFSAGDYGRAAHEALARGPGIFVGGTGFYLRAVAWTQSGADAPEASLSSPQRAEFSDMWERRDADEPGAAHRELARVDPETAASVHPRNVVRTVRALWLCQLHGGPVSQVRRSDPPQRRVELALLLVDPGVDVVDAAIERRCARMFARGWVAEVEKLVADGYDERHKAMGSLGYRQVLEHVRGRRSRADAIASITAATRAYARRQRTYFRHQLDPALKITVTDPETCPYGQLEAFLAGGRR